MYHVPCTLNPYTLYPSLTWVVAASLAAAVGGARAFLAEGAGAGAKTGARAGALFPRRVETVAAGVLGITPGGNVLWKHSFRKLRSFTLGLKYKCILSFLPLI